MFGSNPQDSGNAQTQGQSDQMYNHLLGAFSEQDIQNSFINPIKEVRDTEILDRVNSNIADENAKFKDFESALKSVDNAKSLAVFQGNIKKSAQSAGITVDEYGNISNGGDTPQVAPSTESKNEVEVPTQDPYDEFLNDNKKKQFFATLEPEIAKKVQENSASLGVDPLKYYQAHKEQLEVKEVAESNNSNEETTLQATVDEKEKPTQTDDLPDPNSGWGVSA